MKKYFALLIFLGVTSGVALTGIRFEPGAWYAELSKPAGTLPDWLFPLAWPLLYGLIAVSGWLVWLRHGLMSRLALIIYGLQLVLNAAWSWLFFGLQQPLAGLLNTLLLDIVIGINIVLFWRLRPVAGALLLPYLAWVLYATYLNAGIVILN